MWLNMFEETTGFSDEILRKPSVVITAPSFNFISASSPPVCKEKKGKKKTLVKGNHKSLEKKQLQWGGKTWKEKQGHRRQTDFYHFFFSKWDQKLWTPRWVFFLNINFHTEITDVIKGCCICCDPKQTNIIECNKATVVFRAVFTPTHFFSARLCVRGHREVLTP